ncbi:MAG: DUF6455 family protein [Rhodobacter sp.]|nr:DUF6455 family protein [Rhodobacter sp.]
MPDWIEAARTACLMHGMADKLGVTPTAALADGRLNQAGLDDMVARCRSCAKSDDCILWMVDHATGATAAPDYCLNREELQALRG